MNLDNLKYIEVQHKDKTYYKLVDPSNNAVIIKTTILYCPFGLDNFKDNYTIKLEFNNLCNQLQKKLKNLLEEIDKKNIKFLNCKKKNYKNTIKKNKRYSDITVKIKTKNNRPICNINFMNKKKDYLKTIYELGKRIYLSCDIELGLIWKQELDEEEIYGMTLLTNNLYIKN